MGTCINKKEGEENEIISCCGAQSTDYTKEILCGREQISYYLNNKILDVRIDLNKFLVTDITNKNLEKVLKPPQSYFRILDNISKPF